MLVNKDAEDLALEGFDPVVYFRKFYFGRISLPQEGLAEITGVHNDSIYRMASPEHQQLFMLCPSRSLDAALHRTAPHGTGSGKGAHKCVDWLHNPCRTVGGPQCFRARDKISSGPQVGRLATKPLPCGVQSPWWPTNAWIAYITLAGLGGPQRFIAGQQLL